MGLLDFLRGEKQSAANPSILAISPQHAVFTQRNYEDFVIEGYQTNPYVYAAIRLRGMLLGSIKLQVVEIASDGSKRVLDQHPLLDLMRRPNPMKGGADFLSDHLVYKDISGNAYIEKAGFIERPDELYNLRPDKVKVIVGDSEQPVRGYEYGNRHPVFFPNEQVLHRMYLDPRDDWYGQSPLMAGGQSVDLSNEGRKWNISLLQNQAKPSGVLSAPGSLNDKAYNRLQKLISKRLSGAAAGRPLLAEGGLKWDQMGLSPTDMDWLDGQRLAAIESLVPLNVPPELIGISEAKTYGTFKEALRAVWVNGVLPEAESLMSDLNNWLTPGYGDNIKLWFDKNDIEVLAEDRKMIFDQNVAADWRTVNEKREQDGKDPVPGGDVVLVPLNMVPLGSPAPTADKGVKAIGIVHDDEKVRYWKTIDAARNEAFPGAERLAEDILTIEANKVADAVSNSVGIDAAIPAAVLAVGDSKDAWKSYLDTVYFEVGERFAANVFDRVEKQAPVMLERKGDFEGWRDLVRNYIQQVGANKVTMILDTSRQEVRELLLRSINEELSIPETAALIQETLAGDRAKMRATRIARTEVIAASNAGSQAGAAATGLQLTKTWLPTQDDRTRNGFNSTRNHIDVTDTMRGIAMDQPYTVSNQKLMFPGDTSRGATADNIVNCRCTEIYDTVTPDGIQEIDT